MPADHGLSFAALYAAVPSVMAAATASTFAIATNEYGAATLLSFIGIVARHFYDASKSGSLNFKSLFFDVPTAPMLGIVAYIGCLYFNIEPLIVPGIVILIGFLGPDWLRSLGEGLKDAIFKRVNGGKP